MKRIKLIILSTLMLISIFLTGCGDCDHVYGNWVTTKVATCTDEGEKERVCSECDHKETEKLEALGHDYVDGVCTECGKRE